jgi:hypothetical protein
MRTRSSASTRRFRKEKQETVKKAQGVAGAGLAGIGCLWYVLLPFSVILLCLLIVWFFGVFGE